MAALQTYWPAGVPIITREVWRGRVWTVRPMTIVRDDADLIAYYMAPGTRYLHPRAPDGGPIPHFLPDDWRLVERTSVGGGALYLTRPGAAHVVMRMMDDANVQVAFWYINLQQPLRRTRLGFDYLDHELDIVVGTDRTTWHWKDEDHLAASVERGLLDAAGAWAIRVEGNGRSQRSARPTRWCPRSGSSGDRQRIGRYRESHRIGRGDGRGDGTQHEPRIRVMGT